MRQLSERPNLNMMDRWFNPLPSKHSSPEGLGGVANDANVASSGWCSDLANTLAHGRFMQLKSDGRERKFLIYKPLIKCDTHTHTMIKDGDHLVWWSRGVCTLIDVPSSLKMQILIPFLPSFFPCFQPSFLASFLLLYLPSSLIFHLGESALSLLLFLT